MSSSETVASSSISLSTGVPLLEMEEVTIGSSFQSGASRLKVREWVVKSGELWVVGGLVGTGKSDLLATAAGVLPPREGLLRIFGNEWGPGFAERQVSERLKVGLVHDGGLMLRHLTIAENIALPLQYHHDTTLEEASARTLAWLKEVELESLANHMASGVGRTWGQRAGLARACMLMPELLLLDNPLTGLDPIHVRWWLQMIQRLAEGHPLQRHRPVTLVVTCDDFRPWLKVGTQFAVLREGGFTALSRDDAERDFGLSAFPSDH